LVGKIERFPEIGTRRFGRHQQQTILFCSSPLSMVEVQRHEGFDFDSIPKEQVGLQTNERE